MNSVVNSARYPIHDLNSQPTLDFLASCQSELATFGACHFSHFLSAAGLSACLKVAIALESQAHPSNNQYTPYYGQPDDSYPAGHPRNATVRFAVRYVSRKLISSDSPLRQLFDGDDLLTFIRDLLPGAPLYRYSDPRGHSITR